MDVLLIKFMKYFFFVIYKLKLLIYGNYFYNDYVFFKGFKIFELFFFVK